MCSLPGLCFGDVKRNSRAGKTRTFLNILTERLPIARARTCFLSQQFAILRSKHTYPDVFVPVAWSHIDLATGLRGTARLVRSGADDLRSKSVTPMDRLLLTFNPHHNFGPRAACPAAAPPSSDDSSSSDSSRPNRGRHI
jgi:hypothetical protein